MNARNKSLQRFEPEPGVVYSIDIVARMTHLPRRTIVIFCRHGLVSPCSDPECEGYLFDEDAITALRRLEYLYCKRGINIPGIKMILELLNEMTRLRSQEQHVESFV